MAASADRVSLYTPFVRIADYVQKRLYFGRVAVSNRGLLLPLSGAAVGLHAGQTRAARH